MIAWLKRNTKVILTLLFNWKSVKGNYVIVHKSKLLGNNNILNSNVSLVLSVVRGDVVINKNTRMYNCLLLSHNNIGKNCGISNSTINCFTYIGDNSSINNTQIGKFCSIGPDLKCGYGAHPTNFISTSPIFYSYENLLSVKICNENHFEEYKQIIIGNDVWIGANVFISEGVKIGDGAIVGVGAVVTKDVEPYAIVGGVPAKLIRYRFNTVLIKKLKDFKWWEKDIEWLKMNKEYFNKPLTENMIEDLSC